MQFGIGDLVCLLWSTSTCRHQVAQKLGGTAGRRQANQQIMEHDAVMPQAVPDGQEVGAEEKTVFWETQGSAITLTCKMHSVMDVLGVTAYVVRWAPLLPISVSPGFTIGKPASRMY